MREEILLDGKRVTPVPICEKYIVHGMYIIGKVKEEGKFDTTYILKNEADNQLYALKIEIAFDGLRGYMRADAVKRLKEDVEIVKRTIYETWD